MRTKRVLTAIRVQRVRDLQTGLLLQVRAARVAAGVGHRTINHEIMNFRAMLNWAEKNGLIGQNPIRAIDPLPTDRGHIRRQRRAMSEDEIQRFLAAAAEDDRRVEAQVAAARTIANGTKGPTWNARERRTRVPQLPLWRGFIESGARYGEFTRTQWGILTLSGACSRAAARPRRTARRACSRCGATT
ncbi:MAG: hypothetical protein IPJ77_11240 [Planctomycetes bacterium]|nr:hypothetical protein [Planctomycetota bacterium]